MCVNRCAVTNAYISGTGFYVPPREVTNEALIAEYGIETTHEWIVQRTGIRERRIAAPEELTSTLAIAAAKQALADARMDAKELDLVICATVTGDHPMPATAVLVQQKLGAPNCPAFDISAACAGFVYGLTIADAFIATGRARRPPRPAPRGCAASRSRT